MNPGGSSLEDAFLGWTGPRNGEPSPYHPYFQMLKSLSKPMHFWQKVAREAVTLDAERRDTLPWLFMGMVQYLALDPKGSPITAFLPNASPYGSSMDAEGAGCVFQEFCQLRWHDLWHGVRTRHVQINKVGRNAIFLPLFHEVSKRFSDEPVFLEVGSSVGFGLLWPFLRYDWGRHGSTEPAVPESDLTISCDLRGPMLFNIPGRMVAPQEIRGIEIHPLDAGVSDDCRWLRALVAPGDTHGLRQLNAALELTAKVRPEIVQGCAVEKLLGMVGGSGDRPLFVYHALTEHHLRAQGKIEAFRSVLQELSLARPVVEFGIEWRSNRGEPVAVFVNHWNAKGCDEQVVGHTDPSANGSYFRFA